jgi:hypothetical protein
MQLSTRSFFSFLCILISYSVNAEGWSLAKENTRVQLYTREHASGLFEIKATTDVKTTPSAFINLLMDTAAGPDWIDNAVSVEVLSSPKPDVMIVRTLLNAPWPLKNRDMITQSITTHEKQSGVLSLVISDKSDYAPQSKGRVRMKNVMGEWTLKPSEIGTQITYQGTGEAGGLIPTWLSNKTLINSTFKSFENMRLKVVEDKYQ